ncbi:MAG: sensor domain-containing diguanylate cyclase [Frankiaceae bacterium]
MVDEKRLTAVLTEFARTLTHDFPIQEILDNFVQRLPQVVPVTGAGVLLMDTDHELHFAAASDGVLLQIEGLQIEFDEGPCLETYRTGEPVLLPDLGRDRRFPQFSPRARDAGLAAVFAFPMSIDGIRLGALDVWRQSAGNLEPSDVSAVQLLADVAASYVSNARSWTAARERVEMLRQLALHDPLTGLPNRVLLYDRLEQALAKARRSRRRVAVLFVDLDGFKAINDRYGHHAGDAVLASVADRLKGALRPGDTLARLGGDEFVVLCEELDDNSKAEKVAARITAVFNPPFRLPNSRYVPLSASIGVAFAGEGDQRLDAILSAADAAMYMAKRAGGAQYVVTTEPTVIPSAVPTQPSFNAHS